MALEIDFVIETCLVAIFSRDLLAEHMYLKGGQALRVKENIRSRFSADMDFSSDGAISASDVFFEVLKQALTDEFRQSGYSLFDFKATRRPRVRSTNMPDFWSGWAVEFKLIEEAKKDLPIEHRRREALTPSGANSPTISIDISEHEYCGSVEKVKVRRTPVHVYSTVLLLLEKLRAICQQHPEYPYKRADQRSRDYYDIERLWGKVLKSGEAEAFLNEAAKHLINVFKAKDVKIGLLDRIFEPEFVELQRSGWGAVELTVDGDLKSFDYYNETLFLLTQDIRARI